MMTKRRLLIVGFTASAASLCSAADPDDLGASLRAHYPSLAYVDRYRAAYPADVEGSDRVWRSKRPLPANASAADVTRLLVGLADQHTALAGAKAGKSETLGVLFRTSSDGHMIVWRLFDPAIKQLVAGEAVIAVDGEPTANWLARAARSTFGGNPRSRQAEAASNLALGTAAAHEVAGLGKTVHLTLRSPQGATREVGLPYQPMSRQLATALAAAVDAPDLPNVVRIGNVRVGTIRIGAFAPQYDPVFNAAAEAAATATASKASSEQAADDDAPMLAGFCAVTRRLIARYDGIARRSDLMVVDLRGNMGGFAREVRAFAWALTGKEPERTYDVVASGTPGRVRLQPLPADPGCGRVESRKRLHVLVDAGTRSAGELLATYLWAGRATVIGERTIGAGGGRDSASTGIAVGDSGYRALISENFYVFDPTNELRPGDMDEARFVERVAANRFAPSRRRAYPTQAVGVLPDVPLVTGANDLRDHGLGLLAWGIARVR